MNKQSRRVRDFLWNNAKFDAQNQLMKKTLYTIAIFAAGFIALYEQSKAKPNVVVMVIAIIVFMMGMMQLVNRVPSKNDNKSQDDV